MLLFVSVSVVMFGGVVDDVLWLLCVYCLNLIVFVLVVLFIGGFFVYLM